MKKWGLRFLLALLLFTMIPISAYADMVIGDGLLTSEQFYSKGCDADTEETTQGELKDNVFPPYNEETNPTGFKNGEASEIAERAGFSDLGDDGKKDKVTGMVLKPTQNLAKGIIDGALTFKCVSEFNLISQILKVTSPLNLTHVKPVMAFVGISQMIAMTIAIVLVVVYGIMFTTGFQQTDPIKFFIRLFFAFGAVYYLPYLLQDILNLNNVIVYELSQINLSTGDMLATAGSYGAAVVFFGSMGTFLSSYLGAMVATGAIPGVGQAVLLLLAALAIVFIVLIIKPMVKIIIWWYVRMLMIFLLAMIGPFFVVMLVLPQTADYAKKWLMAFIAETASQIFMVFAVVAFANIFANIGEFKTATNIGFVGTLILIYAMIVFLSEVPGLANRLIGGVTNPGQQAIRDMADGVANFGMVLTGSAISAKNAMKDNSNVKQAKEQQGKLAPTFDRTYSAEGGRSVSISEHTKQELSLGLQEGRMNRSQGEAKIASDLQTQNKDIDGREARGIARHILNEEEKKSGRSWDDRSKEGAVLQKVIDAKGKGRRESAGFGGHRVSFGTSGTEGAMDKWRKDEKNRQQERAKQERNPVTRDHASVDRFNNNNNNNNNDNNNWKN